MIKRGEVYWVNLEPTIGAEIKKTRPALIVSNDINNVHAKTVTVLPMTTASLDKVYPFEVALAAGSYGAGKAAKIKANQIRTLDKRRLGRLVGAISKESLAAVDEAMRLHLGL